MPHLSPQLAASATEKPKSHRVVHVSTMHCRKLSNFEHKPTKMQDTIIPNYLHRTSAGSTAARHRNKQAYNL